MPNSILHLAVTWSILGPVVRCLVHWLSGRCPARHRTQTRGNPSHVQLATAGLPTTGQRRSPVSYTDKVLRCRECGSEFVFTSGEQEFYASRGLMNEPGRCPTCRAARRQRLAASEGAQPAPERSDRPRREMHPAVCAECGAQTTVPFIPRNDKPVYCSTCYDRVRAQR
ncbi:MAG: zinc-ribbon domain containing protein [Chloroflexi bacterium]|nr:zinc-ribbon domain containing protein [Chloroflexota bacterium]